MFQKEFALSFLPSGLYSFKLPVLISSRAQCRSPCAPRLPSLRPHQALETEGVFQHDVSLYQNQVLNVSG